MKHTIEGYHIMTDEEAKAFLAEIDRRRAERMALLKKFGYTSGEGFYLDENGVPRSISMGEDD